MKKSLLFFFLSVCGLTLFAKQMSPEEALTRLEAARPTRGLNLDVEKNLPVVTMGPEGISSFHSLYIFDTDPGFIIVSADDCAMPLLGYGMNRFDPDNMPPQMQYWLDCYTQEIFTAASTGVAASVETYESIGPSVDPLVKTKWNQGNPYNLLCPDFNGKQSAAGCVAVSMAQVMSAHQWPLNCQGGNLAYTSRYDSSHIKTLSLNFDEVTFNWDEMLESYSVNKGTETNKEAVANLIRACGYAAHTFYSPWESTAYPDEATTALYKYFDYSPYVQQVFRNYYTTEEWESLIYNQLSQGLPVMYGGYTLSMLGHRFVCDGYDGHGFFHINWGWGGMSDGYFLLSALNPSSQGIGGADSGYYYDQDATINIAKPDVAIKGASPYLLYSTGNFLSSQIALHFDYEATETVDLGQEVEFIRGTHSGIQNTSCRNVKGSFGISLVSESGETINLYSSNEVTIKTGNKIDKQKVMIPSDLKEGSYMVYPIFRYDNDGSYLRLRCPMTAISSLKMNVENGKATITIGDYGYLTASGAEFKTPVRAGSYFSMDIELNNIGSAPYYGTVGATLKKDGKIIAKTAETVIANLLSGQSSAFNLIGKFEAVSGNLTTGEYELGLFDANNNEIPFSTPVVVDVLPANTNSVRISAKAFDCYSDSDDPEAITFTGTLKCESGEFGGQAVVWIFHYDDENIFYSASTGFFFLEEGETYDFAVTTTVNVPGDYYAYIYVNNKYIYDPYVVFNVPENTGVETVERKEFKVYRSLDGNSLNITSEEMISGIKILNLSGQTLKNVNINPVDQVSINIDNLNSGMYIVIVETTNHHIKAMRFVKR